MVPDDLVDLLLPLCVAALVLIAALALIAPLALIPPLALILVLTALRRDVPDISLSGRPTRPWPHLVPDDPVDLLLSLGVAALAGFLPLLLLDSPHGLLLLLPA